VQRRAGHVFCSAACRHREPRRSGDPEPPSDEVLARLFDDRADDERVRRDDWHPAGHDSPWANLDSYDTLGKRRRWFRTLVDGGEL
jgi:hypothetical protein